MERRRASVRRASLVGVALLLLAGVAGCSNADDAAVATINGRTITRSEAIEMARAQFGYTKVAVTAAQKAAKAAPDDADAKSKAEQAKASLEAARKIFEGEGKDTIGAAGVTEGINELLQIEAARAALRDADQPAVTKAELATARKDVLAQLKSTGITDTTPFQAFLDAEVERSAIQTKLQASFATSAAEREAQLRKIYDEGIAGQVQDCVNILVTTDEAASRAAFARIQAGEDFLAVANEVSIDKTTLEPGSEQCVPVSGLAGVFGDTAGAAKVGDLLGPGDGQGSWLIVRVVSTKTPTFEESRAEIEQNNPDSGPSEQAQAALQKAFKDLDVTVEKRYGTFDEKTGIVEAPKVPGATTTTTTVAGGS